MRRSFRAQPGPIVFGAPPCSSRSPPTRWQVRAYKMYLFAHVSERLGIRCRHLKYFSCSIHRHSSHFACSSWHLDESCRHVASNCPVGYFAYSLWPDRSTHPARSSPPPPLHTKQLRGWSNLDSALIQHGSIATGSSLAEEPCSTNCA